MIAGWRRTALVALVALGLTAAAPPEGSLVLYSTISLEDTTKIVRRFEDRYGIRVRILRLESNQLPARLTIEQRAGRRDVDLAMAPTLQMYALKNGGILERMPVPEERDFIPAAVDPDGFFGGVLINTDTIVYNPERLAAAHLAVPRSWADLTRPQWRGQFALFAHSYEWYLAMKRSLGAEAATALMRGLAANAPHLVASHQLVINQTESGEYLAGANAFGYDALREQRAGRPIAFVNAPPTVAEVNAVGIVRGAPHRNAALLFERWALSRETQQFVVSVLGRSSGRKDVKGDPALWNGRMEIVISDPSNAGDYAEAAREFDRIFGVAG
jgi:iron(III) transport system substrate-binding protein